MCMSMYMYMHMYNFMYVYRRTYCRGFHCCKSPLYFAVAFVILLATEVFCRGIDALSWRSLCLGRCTFQGPGFKSSCTDLGAKLGEVHNNRY